MKIENKTKRNSTKMNDKLKENNEKNENSISSGSSSTSTSSSGDSASSLDPNSTTTTTTTTTLEKNKMIVSNMVSVLNSVKKKHKKAKKDKRKNNKHTELSSSDICFISNVLTNNLKFVSPNPKNNNQITDNISPVAAPVAIKSINTNFNLSIDDIEIIDDDGSIGFQTPTKIVQNAFHIMMNASRKSIGTNSPGKDVVDDNGTCTNENSRNEKQKRTLMLEEWAERKGGKKRKLKEEAEEQYIEHTLEKRAKRFKKLLSNGKKSKESEPVSETNAKCSKRKISKKESEENDILNKVKQPPAAIKIPPTNIPTLTTPPQTPAAVTTTNKIIEESALFELKTNVNHNNKLLKKPKSNDESNKKNEIKTNFIDKLSSPIKKRDSLFGYFNKISSTSNEENEIISIENSPIQKNGVNEQNYIVKKTKKNNIIIKQIEIFAEHQEQTELNVSQSRRPRRECSKKNISYIDIISPEKISTKKNSNKISSPSPPLPPPVLTTAPNEPIIIVKGDCETTTKNNSRNDIKKIQQNKLPLAPIFKKKPTIDLVKLKAKNDFLMSGLPEKMKQEMERQRAQEESYKINFEIFPTISHVTQLTENIDDENVINNRKSKFILKYHSNSVDDDVNYNINSMNSMDMFTNTDQDQEIEVTSKRKPPSMEFIINDKKSLIKLLKSEYDQFPIYRCFKQLQNKYLNDMKMHKEHKKMFSDTDADCFLLDENDLNENVNIENSPTIEFEDTFNNGHAIYTEKYKPFASNEFMINIKAINQFENFLTAWKDKDRKLSFLNESDDDFENTNSSSNFNSQQPLNNAIVLIGPSGCGKTNTVYAIANELNYNVLEINASNKRTGKKIMQQLQEATKSHTIHSNNQKNSQNNTQSTDSSNDPTNSMDILNPTANENTKLSLILIEDADCVFEQDIGFIDAINQLILTSKRPVVLIANHEHCPHLTKLINQQNTIKFNAPSISNSIKWLHLMAITEQYFLEQQSIEKLFRYNRCDLRKTILELQFFIQTNGDSSVYQNQSKVDDDIQANKQQTKDDENSLIEIPYCHSQLYEYFTFKQNPIKYQLINVNEMPKELIEKRKVNSSSSSALPNNDNCDLDFFNNIIEFYNDMTSVINYQNNNNNNRYDDDGNDDIFNNLQKDIADEIFNRSIQQNNLQLNNEKFYNRINQKESKDILTKSILENNFVCCGGVVGGSGQRLINLDIKPCLRMICRSEKHRAISDRTGKKRFYHYLRNANVTSFSTDIFDKYCNVFL